MTQADVGFYEQRRRHGGEVSRLLYDLEGPGRMGRIKHRRYGGESVLKANQWLPALPEAVYRFQSDCRHLALVVPSFIRFDPIRADPGPVVTPGGLFEYRMRLHGFGVFWRTRVVEVHEGEGFIDKQEYGPYQSFVHEHEFIAEENGTRVRDTIIYQPPGRRLAGLVDRAVVKRDLRRLFVHRHRRLAELFAPGQPDPYTLIEGVQPPPVS